MRKRFLVKPRLQLQHLAWTLAIVLVCSCLGYFIFEAMVGKVMQSSMVGAREWMAIRSVLRSGFGVVLLMLLAAIGVENYLLFHSIVGPLYALERGLKRVAQGSFDDPIRVRETDQLKELILSFEEMKLKLRDRLAQQEAINQFLKTEMELLMKDVSPSNVAALRAKLKEIKLQSERKAA